MQDGVGGGAELALAGAVLFSAGDRLQQQWAGPAGGPQRARSLKEANPRCWPCSPAMPAALDSLWLLLLPLIRLLLPVLLLPWSLPIRLLLLVLLLWLLPAMLVLPRLDHLPCSDNSLPSARSLRPAAKSQASMCAAKKYCVVLLRPVTVNVPVVAGLLNVVLYVYWPGDVDQPPPDLGSGDVSSHSW